MNSLATNVLLNVCNGFERSNFKESIRRCPPFSVCGAVSHSCSPVREYIGNGISGRPEALKYRDDTVAMTLSFCSGSTFDPNSELHPAVFLAGAFFLTWPFKERRPF